ncbi:dna replication licensing factor cdc19 (cell division control protein 19) [Moniliophthora roreri]|nr:dna replication licensing factor cdc19 (cell division control protein 19) [Moniliophthora roreri]
MSRFDDSVKDQPMTFKTQAYNFKVLFNALALKPSAHYDSTSQSESRKQKWQGVGHDKFERTSNQPVPNDLKMVTCNTVAVPRASTRTEISRPALLALTTVLHHQSAVAAYP